MKLASLLHTVAVETAQLQRPAAAAAAATWLTVLVAIFGLQINGSATDLGLILGGVGTIAAAGEHLLVAFRKVAPSPTPAPAPPPGPPVPPASS